MEDEDVTPPASPSQLLTFQDFPIHERILDVEVLWQIPNNPRALLLIAHSGCGSPADFWSPHPHCNLCKGLPEHTTIVTSAVSRGYAILAVKSVKDYWQTWPLEVSHDAFNVERIINAWRAEHRLETLPLAALGCASGGSFLSALALKVDLAALVIMTSHGVSQAFHKATNRYPPTLFVHMPKDSLTAAKIEREVRVLQSKGIPTDVIPCLDFAINSAYFADNLPHQFTSHDSSKLFAALVLQGSVNSQGFVISALQSSEIHELLTRADISVDEAPDGDERKLLVERINSLIRVAEARHAVTSRRCNEIFEWLEQYIIRRHL